MRLGVPRTVRLPVRKEGAKKQEEMRMKAKRWALLLLLLMLFCTACGKDDEKKNSGENGGETTPEATEAPQTMEEIMLEKSLGSRGNNYRLKKFLEKVRAGEQVTVAFLGGSITEGYNAGTETTFSTLVTDYLNTKYGNGSNVTCLNAGLSGTPSILGLIRSDRDVFYANPDLVFIEFAVNDGSSQMDSNGFESLLRKALTQPQEPAVIVLNSVTDEGYTCQDNMNMIAFQYGVPSVNVKTAIWSYIEAGTGDFKWSDWADDSAHPNASGHLLYSKFIIHLIELLDSAEIEEPKELPAKFVMGSDHTGMKMVDRSMNTELITITESENYSENGDLDSFDKGWTKTGGENGTFAFTFTGKALYVVFKDTTDSRYGTAEIYVDGEKVYELEGNSEDGWDNPATAMVYTGKESAEHTVIIRMKDGDEEKRFSVLALGLVP